MAIGSRKAPLIGNFRDPMMDNFPPWCWHRELFVCLVAEARVKGTGFGSGVLTARTGREVMRVSEHLWMLG